MKAISYARTGDSSVLTLIDREPREPARDEVRVRVVVSGVNPTDWKARWGGGKTTELPNGKVPNQDGAGVIDAVGAGVDSFTVGDRVWLWDVAFGTTEGTAQQFVTLPAAHVVALPDAESFDTGASLGIPALTAHLALSANDGGPSVLCPGALDGRFVLVTGGAGAVGHAAIQLARWAGATVISTVSSADKAQLALRAGAHHVINYREQHVVAAVREIAPDGVQTIVDVNIAANIDSDLGVIAPTGTISSYASTGDETVTIPVQTAYAQNMRFQFVLTYVTTPQRKADALAGVAAALADGVLRVGDETGLSIARYSLEQTAAAHDAVENAFVGKVLVDVG